MVFTNAPTRFSRLGFLTYLSYWQIEYSSNFYLFTYSNMELTFTLFNYTCVGNKNNVKVQKKCKGGY